MEARINFGSWQIPPVFHWLNNAGKLTWPEILQIFNGGIGYILVLPPSRPKKPSIAFRPLSLRAWPIGEIARRAKDGTGEQVIVTF